jgi:hypothetical protein
MRELRVQEKPLPYPYLIIPYRMHVYPLPRTVMVAASRQPCLLHNIGRLCMQATVTQWLIISTPSSFTSVYTCTGQELNECLSCSSTNQTKRLLCDSRAVHTAAWP